ncbi:hypothetical protein AVEN_91454-1 [Araneus ventricosus]|uniref:Uncharacterized protein n=1 Tax=Araneus ventricosus TaxID=182803 RepID=A0A4Y2N896_ARAVE|nr:hypothetical protein AVEN_91454-1 [Araneus ventricosus]
MQHNRTVCGSATHQMAPPIYYWSTDALNGACAKSLSSTRNGKEEGSKVADLEDRWKPEGPSWGGVEDGYTLEEQHFIERP